MLDNSLTLFLLNVFLIWLFGIIGETFDNIIRWAGRTIGLISIFALFMSIDLCLCICVLSLRLFVCCLGTCIFYRLKFLRKIWLFWVLLYFRSLTHIPWLWCRPSTAGLWLGPGKVFLFCCVCVWACRFCGVSSFSLSWVFFYAMMVCTHSHTRHKRTVHVNPSCGHALLSWDLRSLIGTSQFVVAALVFGRNLRRYVRSCRLSERDC